MFVLLFLCSMGTKAQDLGANYNENIDYPITEIEMLKQSKVTWVRGFVNIPTLFLQNENGKIVGVKENLEAVENFKGSRDEKLVILYCKQLGINYKNLSEEEFRWFIRILKKSKKMGTPISQRKKR